ncbi:MAG: DUF2079 domain-containing protein [Polyangiales bacterium]
MSSGPDLAQSRNRLAHAAVGAAMLVFALLTSWLALARYAAVHNRTYDLALYARVAWGLAHFDAWDPIVGGGPFGGHSSFVLLPLGALGALLGTVPVLLVAQAIAIALSAWPIALIGSRRLGVIGGPLAACAFLLYPNLGHVASYEFHPGTLAILPLCWAMHALDREQPRALAACCAAALACRASIAPQTLMLGLLALSGPSLLRAMGVRIALLSAAYFALSVALLESAIPHGAAGSLAQHFGIWGGSPFGVLVALARTPAVVLAHFAAPQRASYLLRVLAPLAFLPLLRPRLLLVAAPPLALNLVSAFPTAVNIDSHYLTTAVPAFAAGAIEALAALLTRLQSARPARALCVAAFWFASVLGSILAGGLPWSRDFEVADFRGDELTRSGREVLAVVGDTASVQAPDALLPHFAERHLLARQPPPERVTDFVVLDIAHRARFAQKEDLLRTTEEPLVRSWLARPDHGLAYADRRFVVLRRGQRPRAGLVTRYFAGFAPPDSGIALTDCLAVRGADIEGKRLWIELVARGPCPSDLALRLGVGHKPLRVDLLFDGLLSPGHLARGDLLRSPHLLSDTERTALLHRSLVVGALRASGAPPHHWDPVGIEVPLRSVR